MRSYSEWTVALVRTPGDRESEHQAIKQHVEAYIAAGNKITQVPMGVSGTKSRDNWSRVGRDE